MRRLEVALLMAIAAIVCAGPFILANRLNRVPAAPSCAAKVQTAAISQRAAQICSTELVGCSLTFEQVKQVIAEQEAAKGCE